MRDESSDFFKALMLFIGWALLFVVALVASVIFVPAECENAIEGYKEEVGAIVYVNENYVGVMEKYKDYGDGIIASRLCAPFKKGNLLRVEKRDYKSLEAIIDPYVDESGPPYHVVHVELVPVAPGEKSGVP
jgi:hypothetical protein